jgi:hypothetical protein
MYPYQDNIGVPLCRLHLDLPQALLELVLRDMNMCVYITA